MLGAAAALAWTPGAPARPGAPDAGFDGGARVITHIPQPPVFLGGLVRGPHGGSYVIANTAGSEAVPDLDGGDLLLVRYDRRGRPVRRFGELGTYTTSLTGEPARALGMLRQRDGKLVVVGSVGATEAGAQDAFVARFYPDGTLDGAFGEGGVRRIDLGAPAEAANDVALLPGGGLVVVGTATLDYRSNEPFLARLYGDGSSDPTLGGDGVVRLAPLGEQIGSSGEGVVVARDGTLYFGGTTLAGPPGKEGPSPYIARLGPGALGAEADETDLQASYLYGQEADVRDVSIDRARGLVYLTGSVSPDTYAARTAMWVAALGRELRLAPEFGRDGVATVDFPGTISDLAASAVVDSRGRIVLAGSAWTLRSGDERANPAVARLSPAGSLDRSFGRGGRVRLRRRNSLAREIIQQPNGRLLVAGIGGSEAIDVLGAGKTVLLAQLDGM